MSLPPGRPANSDIGDTTHANDSADSRNCKIGAKLGVKRPLTREMMYREGCTRHKTKSGFVYKKQYRPLRDAKSRRRFCEKILQHGGNLEQKRGAEGYPVLTTFKKGLGKRFTDRTLSAGRDIEEVRVNSAGAGAGGYSVTIESLQQDIDAANSSKRAGVDVLPLPAYDEVEKLKVNELKTLISNAGYTDRDIAALKKKHDLVAFWVAHLESTGEGGTL